ncbi:sulfate permease [Solirubrobacter ginsenosidimutans]|uniref:Sulfate permease n=1 Tax=Solirubrobacter ginsenosidimutans TaxID=490573 RepID=A0A9X3RZV4_9ACTN|nr:sulfate permease [Solirubrobacter ginsenosidimutans]MDA0158656.1 sulfate permease [Solirubrobacter ginsenosidimutans]
MDALRGLGRWLPGLALLRGPRDGGLRRDAVAGVVLAALLVPQGMAYAELAGMPPVTGLYATAVPLAVYFLLGPSRILILGPDSAVSPLVAAAIIPLAAGGDMAMRVELAGLLALLVGAIMLAGGLARFGFVTELLSMPVRLGYLAGIAVTVIVAQLPKLFGFSVDAESFIPGVRDFVTGLDETNATALAIGLGSLAVIVGLRLVAPKVPGVFLAVALATAAVAALGLADDVPVVGSVPSGLPAFGVPDVSLDDFKALIPAAVGIAFVAFTDTSVLSRSYAGRLNQEVDQNQELAVLGVANLATGFFQGFPISSSSSRTAVAEDIGARSQLAGVTGALVLSVLLIAGTGLVHDLPVSTLAAVVIVAVLSLIDVGAARRLYSRRRSEFALAMVAFSGVAVLGVLWGIGIAIGLSLLNFIRRAWRPHDAVLGRVDNLKGYHDIGRYPEARRIPGLVLYRFDAPLFFANVDHFRERVRALARSGDVAWIVVAAEPITDIDVTAGEALGALHDELEAAGIELAFAELKDPVRDWLRRYGVDDAIGGNRFFPTIGVAVAAYLRETGVDWFDWEDRPEQPGAQR